MADTARRVIEAFWVGMGFLVVASLYFYLTSITEDGGPERWQRWRAAFVMWNDRRHQLRAIDLRNRPVFKDETNNERAETPQPVGETRDELICFGETLALARMIAAGEAKLTAAVKIGADAKSGEKYQKRSREIKAAVETLQDKYPQRTHEQDALRKELGLRK